MLVLVWVTHPLPPRERAREYVYKCTYVYVCVSACLEGVAKESAGGVSGDEELSPPTTRNDEEGQGEPGGARDVKSGSEKKPNGGRARGNSGMAGGSGSRRGR